MKILFRHVERSTDPGRLVNFSHGEMGSDIDDSERQRPTLNLSRLGQHRKRRTTSPDQQGQQSLNSKRTTSSLCRTPSPVFRSSQGIPIPSSFVYPINLCNDAIANSSSSSSSNSDEDDDGLTATKRQLERLAVKEAIRHKLKLCKEALLSGNTTERAAVDLSSFRSLSDPKVESSTSAIGGSTGGVGACEEKSNVLKENSSTVGRTKERQNDGTGGATSKRQKMNEHSSLSTVETVKAVTEHCSKADERTVAKVDSTHVCDSSHSQPSPQELQLVVGEVFAMTVEKSDGLQSCTLKQFLIAIQAKIPVVFSKETKVAVKERVTFLVKEHVRIHSQGVSVGGLRKCDRSNVCDLVSPVREVIEAPQLPKPQPIESDVIEEEKSLITQNVLFGNKNNSAAISSLHGARPDVETIPSKLKRRPGTKGTANYQETVCLEQTACGSTSNGETVQLPFSNVLELQLPEVVPNKPKRRQTATDKPKGRPRNKVLPSGSCILCSKCPCSHISRDATSSTTLNLPQSDSSIEKALMNRLLKLDVLCDQYDEQTEAVRRRLKKHRREMWKRRENLIQACNNLNANRKGNVSNARFLPDVDEVHQLDTNHNRAARLDKASVAKAQTNIFAPKSTAQATLTQMMASRSERSVEITVSGRDVQLSRASSSSHRNDTESLTQASIDENVDDDTTCTSDTASLDTSGAAGTTSDNNRDNGTSLWGALRSGKFDSTFDALFVESLENHGVDHLLGLLGKEDTTDLPTEDGQVTPCSQSSLSTRGRLLTTDLTNRINTDETRLNGLSIACPNWRENIAYAMNQRDKEDVDTALQEVRAKQKALQQAKKLILRHLEQQEAVLDFFEESLELSLCRFDPPRPPTIEDGFFSSQTQTKSPSRIPTFHEGANDRKCHRQSVDTDVSTIIASALSPSNSVQLENSGYLSRSCSPIASCNRLQFTNPESIVGNSVLCRERCPLPETPLSSDSKI